MRKSLALLACLLIAVPAGAQTSNPETPTETSLYFHVFDTFNKFVINTQEMNANFFDVGGTNNPTIDHSAVESVVNYDLNTMYGTSTAGPVEYQFIENGRPRFHPEKGIAQDVRIVDSEPVIVYLYLDLRDIIGVDSLPTMSPEFAVEVTMREGDDTGRDATLDQGAEIMSGKQTFHLFDNTVAPGAGVNAVLDWATYMVDFFGIGNPVPALPEDGATVNEPFAGQEFNGKQLVVPDAEGIVELAIPMTLAQNIIKKSEAFNVRIDWYQLEEVFGPDAFATGYIRHHASPGKQPRLDMTIMNPIYVEFLHPQVAAGTLLIHAGVNSPWGTYDADFNNMTINVNGPTVPGELKKVVAGGVHVHGDHDKAAEITYLWKFRDEGAEEGDYTIDIDVANSAGSARAKATAGFTIEGETAYGTDTEGNVVEPSATEEKDSPAPFALLGLALAALALIRRRK